MIAPVPRDPQSGVSLLEMLIALALMSMIAVMAASTLRSAGAVLNRQARIESVTEIALARDQLRGWIERAVNDPTTSDPTYAIVGKADELRANSILDDGFFWPGAGTTIIIAPAGQGNGTLSVRAIGVSDQDQNDVARVLKLSGTGGRAVFSYFGRRPETPTSEWHSEWSGTGGNPELIRIAVSDDKMVYPPLIIHPGKLFIQREMSLSSLLPPALPSRP